MPNKPVLGAYRPHTVGPDFEAKIRALVKECLQNDDAIPASQVVGKSLNIYTIFNNTYKTMYPEKLHSVAEIRN